MKIHTILESIGNTPVLRMNRMFRDDLEVWIKLERANPGASIKDRIALAMVEDAERSGALQPGTTIIEPTSGNTGIGLAMVAAVKGYEIVLVMPESMSMERRQIMAAYGARLELTPKEGGMKAAIARAEELCAEIQPSWMPMQFENPSNLDIHRRTTAMEILADFPNGVTAMITGVGTGGHITGCAQALKPVWPEMKVFAVEPEKSPVLSGGEHSPHRLQGIGAGFIPGIMDVALLDGIVLVSEEEAFEHSQRAAKEEGLFVGGSSGATLAAITKKQHEFPAGSVLLGFCYDTGERYLSIEALYPKV